MKCKYLSVVAVTLLAISGVCKSAVLSDDVYTIGLWHMNSITDTRHTMIRVLLAGASHLATAGGNAPITLATGVYGNALNFGTDGRQIATTGVTWPIDTTTGKGQEFRVDGWFYIPTVSCLPIPTAAGGNAAATMYVAQVSASDGSATVWYISISNTTDSRLPGQPPVT